MFRLSEASDAVLEEHETILGSKLEEPGVDGITFFTLLELSARKPEGIEGVEGRADRVEGWVDCCKTDALGATQEGPVFAAAAVGFTILSLSPPGPEGPSPPPPPAQVL